MKLVSFQKYKEGTIICNVASIIEDMSKIENKNYKIYTEETFDKF